MLRKGVEKEMTADPFAVGTLHVMEMPHPSVRGRHPKGRKAFRLKAAPIPSHWN